jgi:hypothetical protein
VLAFAFQARMKLALLIWFITPGDLVMLIHIPLSKNLNLHANFTSYIRATLSIYNNNVFHP